uniref:Putative 7.7 kDa salivary cysteine-rich peptide n=2 Tax=Culicoidea TaxID=41827 RepID=Q6TS20_CULQU|nr:putative 7.7 kDa salivary cysteine-rich peptide [Culex quinquefasciatus]
MKFLGVLTISIVVIALVSCNECDHESCDQRKKFCARSESKYCECDASLQKHVRSCPGGEVFNVRFGTCGVGAAQKQPCMLYRQGKGLK